MEWAFADQWCGRGDSNPHSVLPPPAPQAGASASSATSAIVAAWCGDRGLVGFLGGGGRGWLGWRSLDRCGLHWRRRRCVDAAQDRTRTAFAQDGQDDRTDHEERAEHRRCPRQHRGAGSRTEGRLTAAAAERGGDVATLIPCCSSTTKSSSRQMPTYRPDVTIPSMMLDYTVAVRLLATISAKLSASRLAPPTSAPSTSGCAESSATLAVLTLPP